MQHDQSGGCSNDGIGGPSLVVDQTHLAEVAACVDGFK